MKFLDWTTYTGGFATVERDACEILLEEATRSPRMRSHQLLHESHADPVQRLLVAFAEGTYIQPHRHPEQWEMIMPMRGALDLLSFSEKGVVTARTELTTDTTPAVQIAAGVLHTLVVMTPPALILEIKTGPFRPAEFFELFPSERTPQAANVTTWLATAQVGDIWPS